jgi:hypothetical protein
VFPYVWAGSWGGYFQTGRFERFLSSRAHNDFLLTLQRAMGLDVERFGDQRFASELASNEVLRRIGQV